jgi:ArsR family transcriptional regulator
MKTDTNRQYELATLKAEILKALAHPTRLLMVEALAKGERCVCELNELVPADHSTISKHLSILKKAGILSDRKEGLKVFYRLETPCVLQFMGCVVSAISSRTQKELSLLRSGMKNAGV